MIVAMEYSLWRKDGSGERYAVSKSATHAVWAGGYVIQRSVGGWIIEGDPSGKVYPTGQDAAEAVIREESNCHPAKFEGCSKRDPLARLPSRASPSAFDETDEIVPSEADETRLALG
jgi:hypothetical protein